MSVNVKVYYVHSCIFTADRKWTGDPTIYSSPYASHETATSSHIVKYWYRITCPSIWKHTVYINVRLQSMKRRGTFDWIQCQDGVVLAVLRHTACYSVYWPCIRHDQLPTYKLSLATRLHGQCIIEDDLNKRSAKHTNKSTLVARGADTQLGSSCVLAPLATNVDLWNPIDLLYAMLVLFT